MTDTEGTRSRLGIAAGLGSLLLVAAACTSGAASATPSASASASATTAATASESAEASESAAEGQKIVISTSTNFGGKKEITVEAGEPITVANATSVPHTFTEGENGEAVANPAVNVEIEPGEEEQVTFDKAGDYHVTCRFHQAMNLEVHVE